MISVKIKDAELRKSAEEGIDAFVNTFVSAIRKAIGGELTGDNMGELNSDQITLLGWSILHEEVMDGGFVQLIHNGYGPFFFRNPFSRAVREWGLTDLASLVNKAHSLYTKFGKDLERDCTDEEFMALFEQYPQFDDLDDKFVENEEEWTGIVANYLDEHISNFAEIEDK